MKQFRVTENLNIVLGAWDGVCNKSKTQEDNTLYTEMWMGKAVYKYPKNLICTMYVFGFFRLLKFKQSKG